MTGIRPLSIFCALFIPLALQAQKWERLTSSFSDHYDRFEYAASLEYALKAKDYTIHNIDSSDIRYMLSYYNVALAYHGLSELEKAQDNIRKAYNLMVPNFSYDPNFAEVCELYGRIQTGLGYHQSAD